VRVDTPSSWPSTEADAFAEQDRLRPHLRTTGPLPDVRLVAGIDVAYAKDSAQLAAAVVVLDARSLRPVEECVTLGRATFPYVPGLLAFREIPALVDALERIGSTPDVLVCDGHGIAHPRRFGLACHLGVLTGVASIGVGKSRFTGTHDDPASPRGSHADLVDLGQVIGRVLRTQDGVRPVYVSIGHAVSLDEACALTLRLTPSHRLPEPIRAADHAARTALAAAATPPDRAQRGA
jgi:deoxyribonuclease V